MERFITYKNPTTSQKYDSVLIHLFFHQLSSHQPSTSLLRHHCQRKIIPVAAFVAYLEGVLFPTVKTEPSARLAKVPLIGVPPVLLTTVKIVPTGSGWLLFVRNT